MFGTTDLPILIFRRGVSNAEKSATDRVPLLCSRRYRNSARLGTGKGAKTHAHAHTQAHASL